MQLGSWGAALGLAGLLVVAVALPPVVKIGAIFTEDQRDSATELAFKYAVYKINKDKTLLPYTSLVYDIQYVPRDDSFHASKKACNQVQFGVHAVFGPSDPVLGAHIHSICDALDIPHLEARLDLDSDVREFSINLHPAQHLLNTAFQDVMQFLNWTKVAVIYEEDYGLIKLREIVRSPHNGYPEVHLRQADPESYRAVLKEIKSKEIHNIVIDTKASNMQHFLKGILQLQMNDYKYHYLFTTFDMETFDLEDFKYNFVNMTAFRVVDVADLAVQEVLRDMARFQANVNTGTQINSSYIQAEAALIYDSVFVFAIGLQTLEQSHTLRLSNVSCDKEQPWDGGLSLINYINSVEFKGLSGPVEFKEGRRIQFKLDLLKLKQHALVKVGEWRPGAGVNITDRAAFFDPGTMNVTLVVTTILETPYVMMRKGKNFTGNGRFHGFCVDVLESIAREVGFDYLLDLVPDRKYGARDPATGQWNGMVRELMQHEQPYVMLRAQNNLAGNERYEGFCIDLLREIASMVGFEYRIELVPDSKYGVIDLETGEWNGIVRQLMDKKADLAVGSMTINYARESVIDFTKPFMNLGISILFKVPTDKESAFFSFLNPLGYDIWIFVGGAFFMSSFTLFTLARFTPYEWVYPRPWRRNDYLVNQLSMSNSFWFITGTLLRQTSGVNPQVPTSQQTRLFSFMNPLAMDIWLYVLSAYVLVSITMFVVARFSPYEWHNPHPCEIENELVENQFSLANSFWFTIGTLMQQGSDLNPKATSTRIVGGIWWFFTLIIISSYTANLAAFLTVERMITPIENAEDLAGQTEIPYGTLESGSTMTFFRVSTLPPPPAGSRPLPGLHDRDVQEDVALHGEPQAGGVRPHVRGGHPARPGGQLRLPHGVHHAGLHRAARLQPDPDRRPAGLQGLRHRHPHGQPLARQDLPRHPRAAGEGRDPDAVRQVVEEHGRDVQQERQGQGVQGEFAGGGQHRGGVRGAAVRAGLRRHHRDLRVLLQLQEERHHGETFGNRPASVPLLRNGRRAVFRLEVSGLPTKAGPETAMLEMSAGGDLRSCDAGYTAAPAAAPDQGAAHKRALGSRLSGRHITAREDHDSSGAPAPHPAAARRPSRTGQLSSADANFSTFDHGARK